MFGANPIRKQELRTDGQLWMQEVFRTIQGEGPLAGRPAVFIRLAGCNLACKFCDTEFESGNWRSGPDVVDEACSHLAPGEPEPLFVLTGGEPLRQDIRALVHQLLTHGEVQIETAGTLWLPGLGEDYTAGVQVVVSPKTGKLNEQAVAHAAAFKYILRAGEIDPVDGLPDTMPTGVAGKVARPEGARRCPVYVQPCDDHDSAKNAENLAVTKEVALKFGYRLSLQQHKILELP